MTDPVETDPAVPPPTPNGFVRDAMEVIAPADPGKRGRAVLLAADAVAVVLVIRAVLGAVGLVLSLFGNVFKYWPPLLSLDREAVTMYVYCVSNLFYLLGQLALAWLLYNAARLFVRAMATRDGNP